MKLRYTDTGQKLESLAIAICEAATRLWMDELAMSYRILIISVPRAPLVLQGGSNLKIGYSFWKKN